MGAKKWIVGGAALLLAAACALTPSFARQENGQYIAAAVTSSTYTFGWAAEMPTFEEDEAEWDAEALTATLTVSPSALPLMGASSELSYTVTLEPPSLGEKAEGLELTAQVYNAAGKTCENVTCTDPAGTEEENTWTVTLRANANAEAGIYTLEISLSCTNGVFGEEETVVLEQVFYVNHQTDLSGTITVTSIPLTSDAET